MAPTRSDAPIGIYVHIPFCRHICPYCDFNTYAGLESIFPRYVQAVTTHIGRDDRIEAGRSAASIFIGGGTPSLVPAREIGSIIDACTDRFDVEPDAEITIEANPNGLDEHYLSALLEVGVNRLSIGAQTFNRRGLRVLGRQHEASDVDRSVRYARESGFENISLDLIFGWPGQSAEVWRQDIDSALSLEPDHLSLYNLIVEPGTPMAEAVERNVLTPVDEDLAADLYEMAIYRLEKERWHHYEIANWAKSPDFESRHNRIYWRNGEYAAYGAGAHGRIGNCRFMNHLAPRAYIAAVESDADPVSNSEKIDVKTSMGETMMLGLRLLTEGVGMSDFRQRYGQDLKKAYPGVVEELQRQTLIVDDGDRVVLTRRGTLVANEVCARFV